jgi:hypothetical protein
MPEKPEDVLEHHRIAAARGIERARVEEMLTITLMAPMMEEAPIM